MNGLFSTLGAVFIGVILSKAFAIGAVGIDLRVLSQILDRGGLESQLSVLVLTCVITALVLSQSFDLLHCRRLSPLLILKNPSKRSDHAGIGMVMCDLVLLGAVGDCFSRVAEGAME
jgi:hypothetical protein